MDGKGSTGWTVDFFKESEEILPVRDWMLNLPKEVRAKLLARVQMLREHGPSLDFPYTSQIEGRLRELRLRLGKTRYRVLYFFDERRTCILLHGFTKNTEAVSPAEIRVALQRMSAHESRLRKSTQSR
jgi:phage-related protein